MDVPCPYCTKQTELVGGKEIYPHRPDLYGKRFYLCRGCNAYCGCHPGTVKPLGSPAGPRLRQLRRDAHDTFDRLWKNGYMSRNAAYRWLCDQMDLPQKKCHIGMFNEQQCHDVISACYQLRTKHIA